MTFSEGTLRKPEMDKGKPHGRFPFKQAVCRTIMTAPVPGVQIERSGAGKPVNAVLRGRPASSSSFLMVIRSRMDRGGAAAAECGVKL